MKKINSLRFGVPSIVLIVIFLAVTPAVCQIAMHVSQLEMLYWIRNISLVIGGLLFMALSLILVIELKQGRYMNSYYLENTNIKNKLQHNRYECQNCGYSQVAKADNQCPVCSIYFQEENGQANTHTPSLKMVPAIDLLL